MSKNASGMTFADIQKRHEELGQSDGLIAQIVGGPRLGTNVQAISTTLLHDKENHSFKIRTETEYFAGLCESIRETGIKTPLLVRPSKTQIGQFEILAGHTRLAAAKHEGLKEVPCIVEVVDDATADILMAETNLQRPDWLPSEKAKTFKIWLEAVKSKSGLLVGRPTPTNSATGLQNLLNGGEDKFCNPVAEFSDNATNREIAAKRWGMSGFMFALYIKLNDLIPPLLDMVDENRINVKAGYQLAFLTEEQQTRLLALLEKCPGTKLNEGLAKDIRYLGETEWKRLLSGRPEKDLSWKVSIPKTAISVQNITPRKAKKYLADPELQARITETVTSFILEQEQKSHGKGR